MRHPAKSLSGEQRKAAAERGWLEERKVVLESLLGIDGRRRRDSHLLCARCCSMVDSS